MNRLLTLGSLFDGSGGFPLAGLLAGIVPVWSSEIEPFAIRVTEKRLPQVQHFGNISGLHGDFSAAQERIAALCSTAIDESVRQAQADVLGLEACLRSQCHRFYTSHDWSEVLSALEFHIQIQERN